MRTFINLDRTLQALNLRPWLEADGLNHSDWMVLQAIANRAAVPPKLDQSGAPVKEADGSPAKEVDTCYPSEETLADDTWLSVRTVQRSIKRLSGRDKESPTVRPYIYVRHRMDKSNCYRLNAELFDVTGVRVSNPATATTPQTTPAAKPAYSKPYQSTPNRYTPAAAPAPAAASFKPGAFDFS